MEFSLSIVRKLPLREDMIAVLEPTFKVVIKSEYILKACKDVIRSWPGISWNSDPLEVRAFVSPIRSSDINLCL